MGVMWLEIEDQGPLRWLWLNRPHRRNAVPPQGWGDLRQAFEAFEGSAQRVLVISGRGGDFCSGADLDPSAGPRYRGVVNSQNRMKMVGQAAVVLHRLSKPTVAAVDGVAVGAGMGLALGCDVVIATHRARFSAIFARRGLTLDMGLALGCDVVIATHRARFSAIFARRGLTLDMGLSWLLPRLGGAQFAKEASLSGRMISAAEAKERSLVWDVVDEGCLEERASLVAEGLLRGAPVAQMFIKQGLNRSWELSLEESTAWEGQAQSICLGTDDHQEGVKAFLEKRPPRFTGC